MNEPIERRRGGWPTAWACAILLSLLCGSAQGAPVTKRVDGDVVTYTLAAWVPWAVGIGAIAFLVVGATLIARFRNTPSASAGWAGGLMLGFAGLVMIAVVTVMPDDQLSVRSDGFTWDGGSRREEVAFADCARVEVVEETLGSRFGVKRRAHSLKWHFRDGRPPVIIPLEGPAYAGRYDLVSRAAKQGVGGAELLVWRIPTL